MRFLFLIGFFQSVLLFAINFRIDLTDVPHGGTQVYNQLTRLFQELEQVQAHSGNNTTRIAELRQSIQRLSSNVGPHFTVNGHRYGLFDGRAWRNAPQLSSTVLKELLQDGRTRQELRNLMRSSPVLFRNSIFSELAAFLERFPERSNPPRNAIRRAVISVVTLTARGGAAFGNYTGLTSLANVAARTGGLLSRSAGGRIAGLAGGRALNFFLFNPYFAAVSEVLLNPTAFGNPDPQHGEACIEVLQNRIGRVLTLKRVIAEYRCQSVSSFHCDIRMNETNRNNVTQMIPSREASLHAIRRTIRFDCPFFSGAAGRLRTVLQEIDDYDFGEDCDRQIGMLVQPEFDENPCERHEGSPGRSPVTH